jgi:hypothetical protein
MAKGRMLNKRISQDHDVAALVNELSGDHGLVFTWMIAHLDRDGRLDAHPEVIRGLVAPLLSRVTPQVVTETIQKAAESSMIEVYEDDRGRRFLVYPQFSKNQRNLRYDREPTSEFPDPEVCRNISGSLPEVFRNIAGSLPEGIRPKRREENIREEKRREENNVKHASRAGVSEGIIADIWGHYRLWHLKASKRCGAKNAGLIKARLAEGSSPDDLKAAIDGYHRDPWHCGDNDRGKKYLSLSLILRDADHVLKGLEMNENPERPKTRLDEIQDDQEFLCEIDRRISGGADGGPAGLLHGPDVQPDANGVAGQQSGVLPLFGEVRLGGGGGGVRRGMEGAQGEVPLSGGAAGDLPAGGEAREGGEEDPDATPSWAFDDAPGASFEDDDVPF